jgi:hypothetical protein
MRFGWLTILRDVASICFRWKVRTACQRRTSPVEMDASGRALTAISQCSDQHGAVDLLSKGNLRIRLRQQELCAKRFQSGCLGCALGACSLDDRQRGLANFFLSLSAHLSGLAKSPEKMWSPTYISPLGGAETVLRSPDHADLRLSPFVVMKTAERDRPHWPMGIAWLCHDPVTRGAQASCSFE